MLLVGGTVVYNTQYICIFLSLLTRFRLRANLLAPVILRSPLTFGKLNFSISSVQQLNLMDYEVREIQMR